MLDRPIMDAKRESLVRIFIAATGAVLVLLLVSGIGFFIFWQMMERDRQAAEAAHLASMEIARQKAEAQPKAAGPAEPDVSPEAVLLRFGQDYSHTLSELGRPPQAWREMKRRNDEGGAGVAEMTEPGQKKTPELQVDWGVDLNKLSEEQQTATPLAWERDPDNEGRRWCLFADLHTLRQLAKEEFAKLRPSGK